MLFNCLDDLLPVVIPHHHIQAFMPELVPQLKRRQKFCRIKVFMSVNLKAF